MSTQWTPRELELAAALKDEKTARMALQAALGSDGIYALGWISGLPCYCNEPYAYEQRHHDFCARARAALALALRLPDQPEDPDAAERL